eukprot:TRINITY_DN1936_c0_g3_i1.p1 TRINITY_DN1936_c0_g3~~TRINITY_DN1936_c0_g3_i1.p1  ORF type:complete len:865 (+),score=362.99 TRINITY_DN1936_c0_g3_i1:140-2734(+)
MSFPKMPDAQVVLELYVRFLQKWRVPIWAVFLLILGLSGWGAPSFINATTQNFAAPSDSLSAKARRAVNAFYPQLEQTSDLAIFIEFANKSAPVITSPLGNFSFDFCAAAKAYDKDPDMLLNCGGYFSYEAMQKGAGAPFVSHGGEATFMSLTLNKDCTSDHSTEYANWLEDTVIPNVQRRTGSQEYRMTMLGCSSFIRVMIQNSAADLERMDAIVLPLAMLTLALILGSLRLLLISVACLIASVGISFAVMYGVTFSMDVFSAAPSLMMSILIAMTIDYGLFLLSRYSEELQNQLDNNEIVSTPRAVVVMLRTAGHTITVSGLTLAASFGGLMFFRVNMVQSFGVGCGVVLMVVLMVNLFLVPMMLLTFPTFFEACRVKNDGTAVEGSSTTESQVPYGVQDTEVAEGVPVDARSASSAEALRESRWYKLGMYVSSYPMNIAVVLVVLAAVAPFSLRSFSYTTTDENIWYLPKGAAVTNAYVDMGTSFGYGQVASYQVMFTAADGVSTILNGTDNFATWKMTQEAVEGLSNLPFDTELSDYTGPSSAGGQLIPPEASVICSSDAYLKNVTCENFEERYSVMRMPECRSLFLMMCTFMNKPDDLLNSTAMMFRFAPRFAPMGPVGADWLNAARDFTDNFTQTHPVKIYFVGTPADSLDAMSTVDDDFLPMVLITTGILFAFVFISFKSLFIPLRSVATIAVTIIWVYGFATMTYEDCTLSWTHFMGFDCTHAVVYMIPLMSFSIVVGIGLDYDVFLVTRIVECYQEQGCSTQEAICQGLARTGYLITAAGVIMALAFCGLFFSKEPFVHQLSFYMVFAVLFDTFVVRSLLVPALMGLLGELNWWPFVKRRDLVPEGSPLVDNADS